MILMIKKILPKSVILRLRNNKIIARFVNKIYKLKTGKNCYAYNCIKKQSIVTEYKNKYNILTLIETGTFLGDMVYAQRKNFKKIISIELDQNLFKSAHKIFNKYSHIKILQGDSGKVLHEILPTLQEKALFWLDGHYSGGITAKGEKETPIFEELNAIFKNDLGHIILIDDAKCFNGKGDYPTIENLKKFIVSKNNNYKLEVKEGIIRVVID